jgi:hypothetical protein
MNELGWKHLKQRRQENRLILLHKGLHGYANIPISDINQNKRKQRKGHNQQFQIPHARTDTIKDSFIPKTLKDWNQLDPNILQKSTSAKDPTSRLMSEMGMFVYPLSPLCSRMSLFSCLRCFSCFQPNSFIIDVIDPSSSK